MSRGGEPTSLPILRPIGAEQCFLAGLVLGDGGDEGFGGGERRISAPDFTHAELTAIFGGFKLDLRKATMKGSSAVIDATAIFGGVEIVVPETWNVIVRGVGIFGGYGDESHHPAASEPAPELIVQGVAMFGGVAIKN